MLHVHISLWGITTSSKGSERIRCTPRQLDGGSLAGASIFVFFATPDESSDVGATPALHRQNSPHSRGLTRPGDDSRLLSPRRRTGGASAARSFAASAGSDAASCFRPSTRAAPPSATVLASWQGGLSAVSKARTACCTDSECHAGGLLSLPFRVQHIGGNASRNCRSSKTLPLNSPLFGGAASCRSCRAVAEAARGRSAPAMRSRPAPDAAHSSTRLHSEFPHVKSNSCISRTSKTLCTATNVLPALLAIKPSCNMRTTATLLFPMFVRLMQWLRERICRV